MTRDLRKYSRQTNFHLLVGFFLLLLVIGIGLIYLIYGRNAALMGLLCTGAALIPMGLIWLVLWVMGLVVKKANE